LTRTFREFDIDVKEDKELVDALFRENKVTRWQAIAYPQAMKDGKTITFVKIFIEWEEPDAPRQE
jgi:hypothetical protein